MKRILNPLGQRKEKLKSLAGTSQKLQELHRLPK
jgi:hypothetical protein